MEKLSEILKKCHTNVLAQKVDKKAKECGEMTNKNIKEDHQTERIHTWKKISSPLKKQPLS